MIVLKDDSMMFLEEKEVFLAFYGDIKDEIGELKCAWSDRKVSDSDVIIFESLHRSEEKIPYIYDEGYGEPGNYAEVRHICTVNVFHRNGGNQPIISEESGDEQLQEIIEQYEKVGFGVPYTKLHVPYLVDSDGTKHDQLIVVISTLESQGEDDEEECEEEE